MPCALRREPGLEPSLPWQAQLLLFGGCALPSVAAWFWYRHRRPPRGGDPSLNRRGLSYVGTEAVLTVATGLGRGRVKVADGTWPAEGPALPAGARVRIVGARGTVLLVAPAENGAAPPSGGAEERAEGSQATAGSSM